MLTMTHGQRIAAAAPGAFFKLDKVRPVGSLFARKQLDGAVALYWRYAIGAQSHRVLIGYWDSQAPPKSHEPTPRGYSIAAAIREAEEKSHEHHLNRDQGGRPAIVAAEKAAQKQAAEAKEEEAKHTLKALLDLYADDMTRRKKAPKTISDVKSIFKNHVSAPWPKIASLPANQVTPEQIADMMRRIHEGGHGRTANKLRSYLSAAFEFAKFARTTPTTPIAYKAFKVRTNPAGDTKPDRASNRSGKNALTVEEMHTYWMAIKDKSDFHSALLRLHLLTGGQRMTQLVRLLPEDIVLSEDVIVLYDGKGRREEPRVHVVPLIAEARRALADCKPGTKGYALSTDGGQTHVNAETLAEWAHEAVPKVIVNGEEKPAIEGFQAKRIRSGVETLLAAAKVSKDLRGRLQSHGIGGVQDTHYDDHEYVPEVRALLETVYAQLEATPRANVTPIGARRHRRA